MDNETDNEKVVITKKFLLSGMTGECGINYSQLRILGIEIPPESGWKERVIGKEISKKDADLFLSLKGKSKKSQHSLMKEFESMQFSFESQEKTLGKEKKVITDWIRPGAKQPKDKQLVAFITQTGMFRTGTFQKNGKMYISKDRTGKEYPYKYVQYLYPLPDIPDDVFYEKCINNIKIILNYHSLEKNCKTVVNIQTYF